MKAHLAFVDTPLGTGSHAKCACGEEIWHSRSLFMWDTTQVGVGLEFPKGVCTKCIKSAGKHEGRVYCYGISEQ